MMKDKDEVHVLNHFFPGCNILTHTYTIWKLA